MVLGRDVNRRFRLPVFTSYLTAPLKTTCRKFSECSWRGMNTAGTVYLSNAIPPQCTGAIDFVGQQPRNGSIRPSRSTFTPGRADWLNREGIPQEPSAKFLLKRLVSLMQDFLEEKCEVGAFSLHTVGVVFKSALYSNRIQSEDLHKSGFLEQRAARHLRYAGRSQPNPNDEKKETEHAKQCRALRRAAPNIGGLE